MYNGFNGDAAATTDACRSVWLCLKNGIGARMHRLHENYYTLDNSHTLSRMNQERQ